MISLSVLPLVVGAVGAGALLSLALYDAAGFLPRVSSWLRSSLTPLRRAGEEGYTPDSVERRRLAIIATITVFSLAVFLTGVGPFALLAVAGPPLVFGLINRRRSRYLRRVEAAIPEVAAAVSDALSGGASLPIALVDAGRSLHGAPAREFARIRVDLSLGLTAREALEGFARRLESERVDALVTLLLTASTSGGDLVLLLRRFGEADLSRRRALKDADSATAQARYTGLMVVALPAGASLFAEMVRPGFFSAILGDPASALLLLVAALLQVFGLFVVRRLGKAAER